MKGEPKMRDDASEYGDTVTAALEWAKKADDTDGTELVQKFAQRINERAETRLARVHDMAARHLCEQFNHYDGARRMRACDNCRVAVRIASVFDLNDSAPGGVSSPEGKRGDQ